MSYNTDISNLDLANQTVSYDPDAELNPNRTVPDGTYFMELSLGKPRNNQEHPVILTTSKSGKSYVEAQVTGKIVAPGGSWDNKLVFGQINSLVFENSNTSAIHQMLKAIGKPAPGTCTLGELATLVTAALGGGAQCNVRTRWEVSTKDSNGKYITIRGMKKFPQLANGSYDPSYTFTLEGGEEVTREARPQFSDFQPSGTAVASGN